MRIAPPPPRHPGSSLTPPPPSSHSVDRSASGSKISRDADSRSGTDRRRNGRSLSPAPRSFVPPPTSTTTETTSPTKNIPPLVRRNSTKLIAYMNRYQDGAASNTESTTTTKKLDPAVQEELAALSGIKKEKAATWMKKKSSQDDDDNAEKDTTSKEGEKNSPTTTTSSKVGKQVAPWKKKVGSDPAADENKNVSSVVKKEKVSPPPWTKKSTQQEKEQSVSPVVDMKPDSSVGKKEGVSPVMNRYQPKVGTEPAVPDKLSQVKRKEKKVAWMQKDEGDNGKDPVKNKDTISSAVKRKEKLAPWMKKQQENDSKRSPPIKMGTVVSLSNKSKDDVGNTSPKTEKITTVGGSPMLIKKGTVAALTRKQKEDVGTTSPKTEKTTKVVSPLVIKKGTVASLARKQKEDANKNPLEAKKVSPPTRKNITPPWMKEKQETNVGKATPSAISKGAVSWKKKDSKVGKDPTAPGQKYEQKKAKTGGPNVTDGQDGKSQVDQDPVKEKESSIVQPSGEPILEQEKQQTEEQTVAQNEQELPEMNKDQGPSNEERTIQDTVESEEAAKSETYEQPQEQVKPDSNEQIESAQPSIQDELAAKPEPIEKDDDVEEEPKATEHELQALEAGSGKKRESLGLENSIGVLELEYGESFVVTENEEEEEVEEDDDDEEDDGGGSSSAGGAGEELDSPRSPRRSSTLTTSFDLDLGPCEEVSSFGETVEEVEEILEYEMEDLSVEGKERFEMHKSKCLDDLELRRMFSKANLEFDMDDVSDLEEVVEEMTEIADETEVEYEVEEDDDALGASGSLLSPEEGIQKSNSGKLVLSPAPHSRHSEVDMTDVKAHLSSLSSPNGRRRSSVRHTRRMSELSIQSEYSEYVMEDSEADMSYMDEEIIEGEGSGQVVLEEVEEEEVIDVTEEEYVEDTDDAPLVPVTAT